MSAQHPSYYKVCLTPQQSESARRELQATGSAQLHIDVEIVELGQGMQALSWVWAKDGSQRGVLRQCKLTPAQWAECMLVIDSGKRPVYRVQWNVLGQLEDGNWGVAGGEISALDAIPSGGWGELEQLTGLRA